MVRANRTARVFSATHSSSVPVLKMNGRHGAGIGDTRHVSIQTETPGAISATTCQTSEIQHMDELFWIFIGGAV